MKNKLLILFAILIIVVSIAVITFKLTAKKDPNSIENFIDVYEKEQNNYNLIALCNKLSIEKDKRLFVYFDDFMNMSNFDEEIKKYEGDNSNVEIDYYHDLMITRAFEICVKSNDMDLLSKVIRDYYPQIRDKDKLFYLSLANDGSESSIEFFKTNSDIIVNVLDELYVRENNPKSKLHYLMEISTYYTCNEVNDFDSYKEKYDDELAVLVNENVAESDLEKVAIVSTYFKSYWEHLLTGKENDTWNSAFSETQSKYNQA